MTRSLILLSVTILLSASAFGQSSETMTIKVFFHNEGLNPNQQDCTKVFPTMRTIPKTKAVARAALDEVLKGVTAEEAKKEFVSFPHEDTKDC